MKNHSYLQCFGDVELAVRSRGKGLPFVWGHSLMGSMRVEDHAALWDWSGVEHSCEVVRYDARGHGNSDGSYNKDDYQWTKMAEDMLAVANGYAAPGRQKRFLLGGISMGAATALEAATQRPDQLAGLVLVLPPTAWQTRPRQAAIYRRLARVSGFFGAAPYRLLDLLPIPMRDDGRSQLTLHTMKGLATANPLHVHAALGGAAQSDMPDPQLLRQLQIPTLILAWEDDAAHPVFTARDLAGMLPDVRGLVVCDAGDISEWQIALEAFVKRVVADNRPRLRKSTASDATVKKRKRSAKTA